MLKERKIDEAEEAIEYLQDQIELTTLVGLQNVFYNLIELQSKELMLASISDNFVFRTIDPALVEERKAFPNRAVICVYGLFVGLLLSLSMVLIFYSYGSFIQISLKGLKIKPF